MTANSKTQPSRPPRRTAVISAIVTLFVLFHLAGGWYFSSQIRSDALLIKPEVPEYTTTVVAVGDSTITFDTTGEASPDVISGATLGVASSVGYGQAGPVLDRGPASVTRRYTHLAGLIPAPGMAVQLEGYAFPADPSTVGVNHVPVDIHAPVGDLPAWFVPGASDRWAIVVHGRGAHMREGLRVLPTLVEAGLPTLLISYRNDAGAPATADRLARFGTTEWEDLEAAVSYAVDNGADDVVIVGFSMGAAVTMSFLERSPMAPRVAALVFDSPALDLSQMIAARAADMALIPGLPIPVPPTLTVAARGIAEVRFDLMFGFIDYLERPDLIEAPLLLIHGDADASVPVDQSSRFAAAVGSRAQLEIFPGAGHVRSWNVHQARYEAAVAGFLAKLAGPQAT